MAKWSLSPAEGSSPSRAVTKGGSKLSFSESVNASHEFELAMSALLALHERIRQAHAQEIAEIWEAVESKLRSSTLVENASTPSLHGSSSEGDAYPMVRGNTQTSWDVRAGEQDDDDIDNKDNHSHAGIVLDMDFQFDENGPGLSRQVSPEMYVPSERLQTDFSVKPSALGHVCDPLVSPSGLAVLSDDHVSDTSSEDPTTPIQHSERSEDKSHSTGSFWRSMQGRMTKSSMASVFSQVRPHLPRSFSSQALLRRSTQVSTPSRQSARRSKREERFKLALTAQMREQWVLPSALDQPVPRWSRKDFASLFSIDPVDEPGDHTPPKSAMVRSGSCESDSFSESVSKSDKLTRFEMYRSESRRTTRRVMPKEALEPERVGCVIHPQSRFKITVDLLGILFMLYDFVMTPLEFFDISTSTFFDAMGWITRIFWILDIWINFHTATFVKGLLVNDWLQIAKEYSKNMFVPDLLIVSAEWFAFFIQKSSFGNISFFRVLKVLRFIKVMRIFKLELIVAEFKAQINSTFMLLLLRPIIIIIALLFYNHMIACFWYGIGTSSELSWISVEEDHTTPYLYTTSLHWAIGLLHGNVDVGPLNTKERVFQCSMTIVALIMLSALLSSTTSAMMQIHSLRQEKFEFSSQIRDVLAHRHISAELTARIKKRLQYNEKRGRFQLADEKIIKRLPQDLVVDLFFESRLPIVNHHAYFFTLGFRCPRIMRQLCNDAMEELSQNETDETIFTSGDACLQMFFIDSGECDYVHCPSQRSNLPMHVTSTGSTTLNKSQFGCDVKLAEVSRKDYLCEAALWMKWEYCGILTTRSPVSMLTINAQRFCDVMKHFHFAHVNSSRYAAHFVQRMVTLGRRTDLALPD